MSQEEHSLFFVLLYFFHLLINNIVEIVLGMLKTPNYTNGKLNCICLRLIEVLQDPNGMISKYHMTSYDFIYFCQEILFYKFIFE